MKKENIIKYFILPFEILILLIVGHSYFQSFIPPPESPEKRFWGFLFISSSLFSSFIVASGYFFGEKIINYQNEDYNENKESFINVFEKIITLVLIYSSIFGILVFSIYLYLIIFIPYQVLSIFKVITIPLPIFILITIWFFITILLIEIILIFIFALKKK